MEKYQYTDQSLWLVRLTYAVGILSWLGVVYGYIAFFNLNPLYWFIFAPVIGIYTIYYLISYGINLFYPGFSRAKHDALVKETWKDRPEHHYPLVDVFLPVCGEPIEVLSRTFYAVANLDYSNKKVYVLDDKGQATVKALAESLGFNYLSRPNKGEMKKAGNLKYGYEHSDGQFIAVFDADFAPYPEFIKELLPYAADDKIGIVQSPQYFQVDNEVHDRSKLEYGAGNVQEDFYRIIQTSRNRFEGAICVGSNALYSRNALDAIGGPYQIEHSEDVHTGVRMVEAGYKVKYIPVILAKGLCPADMHSFWHQQHRWCSGSMSLLFSKRFWTNNLTWKQRLCFMSGFLYYIVHAISPLMSFQVFVLLIWHYDFINIWYAIPFFPYLFYSFVVLPFFFRLKRPKYGTVLVRSVHTYSYAHAVFSALFGRKTDWLPTGVKHTISSSYRTVIMLNLAYLAIYLGLTIFSAAIGHLPVRNYHYYSVVFWVFYNIIIHIMFSYHAVLEYGKAKKYDQR